MNIIEFLKQAAPNNGITTISVEMMNFDLENSYLKKELAKMFGARIAMEIVEAARPEFERIRAIIARVQPGIDYGMSMDAVNAFEADHAIEKKLPYGTTGEIDVFVKKGRQEFAVDGSIAYDITECITHFADDDAVLYRCPFKLGGKLPYYFPDEGRGGLAMVTCISKPGKNASFHVGISSCGWIHTEELRMSPAHISENIANEIDAGHNVLTTAPAGWA
ncbi:hypothetical protein ACQE3D_25515 (plasmid) [Methylomonas sp. MS20]|uniref:hypothetical protein n=1 Tax=Methylomonas sp. MS20 TaxID=3418769 RepID=UPI003D0886CF